MAMTAKEKEALATLKKSFPNMGNNDLAQLMGIWSGEANLEKARTEDFPLYVNEKGFADLFSAPFQSTREGYPTEASIVKKYKTEKGSAQTKQLLKEERSLWVMPKERAEWLKNLKNKYNIPVFDPSKSHNKNKEIQNAALKKIPEESRKALEKEFYDKVYGSPLSNVKGGFFGRGVGPIQVTGTDNIVKSLRTASKMYDKPDWASLADIVENDPSKIESNIRNNPELETALSMAWVKDNLVNEKGGLKGSNISANNKIVNTANAGLEKKQKAADKFSKLLGSETVVSKPSSIPPPPSNIDPSDTNAIKTIQTMSGLTGKAVDGIWGEQSAKAYAKLVRDKFAQTDPRRVDAAPSVEVVPEPTPIRNYAAEEIVNSNNQRAIEPIRPLERNYQYQTMEDLIKDRDLLNPLVGRF